MQEYIPATISIGGSIKKELLDELANCLVSDGVGFDYDETETIIEILKYMKETLGKMTADFVGKPNYGEFTETENFCKKHNIDFDRHSDCMDEFEAENYYLRNGKSMSFHSLSNGIKDMILIDDVLALLENSVNKDAPISCAISMLKNTICERPEPLQPVKLA